jgi:hypothetical protein
MIALQLSAISGWRSCRFVYTGGFFVRKDLVAVAQADDPDLATSSIADDRNGNLWLAPAGMTKTPTGSAVESARPPPPEAWSPEAPWTDGKAEGNWRREEDRARRWRRIIVSRCGCPVRLNCIGAGIRAHNESEREREHRQSCHNKFCSHRRYPSYYFCD